MPNNYESRDSTKYYSLKKALAKEMKKPNKDKEVMLMLEIEIKKLEPKLNLSTKNVG